ncbi:MAG TPA: MarR family transcriptional regulator, partial [Streptomyces sp.]
SQPQRPPQPAGPSPAYLALAQLGRVDHRIALSAADCAVLEELAGAWLDRGVNADYLIHAVSSGLPAQVDSPVGFVRRRLRDKLPPVLASAAPAAPAAPGRRLMLECTKCGIPGRPEALPDGLCRACRTPDGPAEPAPAIERDVHAHVNRLRELLRAP